MHTMILSAAALIASAAALSSPTPSSAQWAKCPIQADAVPIEGAVVVVSYADLDITRPDQARILDRRLNMAASRVCDNTHLVIGHYRLRHLCIREALCDARRQVALRSAEGPTTTWAALVRRFH